MLVILQQSGTCRPSTPKMKWTGTLPATYAELCQLASDQYHAAPSRGGVIAWIRHNRTNYDAVARSLSHAEYLCFKSLTNRLIAEKIDQLYVL